MISLPFYSNQSSKFYYQANLGDKDGAFTFHFSWNTRLNCWFLDIWDEENLECIQAGIRLSPNYGLLQAYSNNIKLPAGELIVFDNLGLGYGLDYDNIGVDNRFELIYMTEEEINGI